MKFRTIFLFSLGCLFSCMLLASCEDSMSEVSVNERQKRDTRRRQSADSNESDDQDDDDDDATKKEYSRRLALQQVIRKLRKLPLSRRQLIKLVSRLRTYKKSNKPITMSVLKDIMKEVVATKKKAPGVKITTITAKPSTTTTPPTTKAPTKNLPSITDGQLVSVQKAPKKPIKVEAPKTIQVVQAPERPIHNQSVKPAVYSPPVISKPVTPQVQKQHQVISKPIPPQISNPYIPPPKAQPPVVKVQITHPPPTPPVVVVTKVKSDVKVVPMSDGSNVPVDTRITPELKLNIDHIPVHMRTQALFQRLSILRQRLNNFKKLRERQNAAREPVPAVVKTSLSGSVNTASAPVVSKPKETPVTAVAYSAPDPPKSFSLSSPSQEKDVPYITKDQAHSVLQTKTTYTSPAGTGSSNLSSPPRAPSVTSAEMTHDESSRVKKIILVIQRLASRSGSKKLKVSSKAKELLIKWVRKYKNAISPKQQISSQPIETKSTVHYELKHMPVDQVGTKSLHSNIPLSSTAEMANPQMMENDIIKQKIKKSDKGGHKSLLPMVESSKDTYISDSALAKSHFNSAPKTSSVQDMTKSKTSQRTVVENSKSTINAPVTSIVLEKKEKNPVISKQKSNSLKQNEKEPLDSDIKIATSDSNANVMLDSNIEKAKIENVIEEAPEHIHATFLPPVIEDPALKESNKKEEEHFENSLNTQREQTAKAGLSNISPVISAQVVQSEVSNVPETPLTSKGSITSPVNNDHVSANEKTTYPDLSSSDTVKTRIPELNANEEITSDPFISVTDPKSLGETESVLSSDSFSLDVPTETNSIPQTSFNVASESKLDQSPYKKLPSENFENGNQIKTVTDHLIAKPAEQNSESNITPLFQKQSQNTFYKNDIVNRTPVDTVSVDSNLIQTSRQNPVKSLDEPNSLPVFQQVSRNTFSEAENVITPTYENILNENTETQAAQASFVVSVPESSNTVPVLKASNTNTFEIPEPTNTRVEVDSLTNTGSNTISNSLTENPNIEHSLPGVIIDTALLQNTNNPKQSLPQNLNTIQEVPTTPTPKSIQNKLEGIAIILPDETPVQVRQETKVIETEPKPINFFDINSSQTQKNINTILPKEVPTFDLPPLSLHIPQHSPPLSSNVQNSNKNTPRINVPNNSSPNVQTQRSNFAIPRNNVPNQRPSNSFAISLPNQKPEIDNNRFGKTSLDKSAILRKLLEIRRMREQLIATGRVSDRRLSDLLPQSRSSLSHPSTLSRPQQSASLSQNTVVFWGDKTKPSLTNPLGMSRAHRRRRSLLSPPIMHGNIGPHHPHSPHHPLNQMFVDTPLHSLSYNKKRGNRVDLYGGLGSLSGAHHFMGPGTADMANPGSLSMGPVHPNVIQDIGMTKLGRFFQKPVHFTHQPEIPNIANVVNRIFAPGRMNNSPQLFAGNSLSTSVHKHHHKTFRPNGSVRRPSYVARKSMSGFPKRQNFVETAPVKLRTSNTHGVQITVKNDGSAGSLAHQQNLQRQGFKRTFDTSFTDNSLSLGAPKSERPIYNTVRRIVILPLPTGRTQDLARTNEIVKKKSHYDHMHLKSHGQSSKTGYLAKAKPETKPYDQPNKTEFKTLILNSQSGVVKESKPAKIIESKLSIVPLQNNKNSQINEKKSPSTTAHFANHMRTTPIGKSQLPKADKKKEFGSYEPKSSHYTGNALSLAPPNYNQMKDSSSFVKFAFSLNSPASMFMNNVESQPTKVEPIAAGYSGSISAAPNSLARAEAGKDKAGPALSATPYIGPQKTSNTGIVFEEIDPLSLTNFIMAASEDINHGLSDIKMSKAPVQLPDNSVKRGVVLEIPEKNDFIGQNTQREKKNSISLDAIHSGKAIVNQVQQVKNTQLTTQSTSTQSIDLNKQKKQTPNPTNNFKLSQRKQTPFSFSLSGLSMGSHTHSPKTTVSHSVKPTIKPTIGTPLHQRVENMPSGHLSSTRHEWNQNHVHKHEYKHIQSPSLNTFVNNKHLHQNTRENMLVKNPTMDSTILDHKQNEVVPNAYQYINNSRIQYQRKEQFHTTHSRKTQTPEKPPSGDYVHQSSLSLSSFRPAENSPVYNIVGQNFDNKDKFASPFGKIVQKDPPMIIQTAPTTPASRSVEQRPTTPSWQSQSNNVQHHQHTQHTIGKIGHYHKEPVIEVQGNSLTQTFSNQPKKHSNQIYSSSLSSFNHQGQRITQPSSSNVNPETNLSKSSGTHVTLHAMETSNKPKQWTPSNLLASNKANPGYKPVNQKPMVRSGFAVSNHASSNLNTGTQQSHHNQKTSQRLMRPTHPSKLSQNSSKNVASTGQPNAGRTNTLKTGQVGLKPPQNVRHNLHNRIPQQRRQNQGQRSQRVPSNNQINIFSRKQPKDTPIASQNYPQYHNAPQHHTNVNQGLQQHSQHRPRGQNAIENHGISGKGLKDIDITKTDPFQQHSTHHGAVVISQHTGQSTEPRMTQRPPAQKQTIQTTPIPIELNTPSTTKIPVFATGNDHFSISPQLLALMRQLPVGDLPVHKKRRLEKILGVENGQLDRNTPEQESVIDNVIHEKSIQTGKASRFEVSQQRLASSNAHYVQPSSLVTGNSNTRKSLGDFFIPERATNNHMQPK